MRYFEVVKDEYRKHSGYIKLPTRATKGSAGYDFYSPISVDIEPMCSQMIWTDVCSKFEDDEVLLINVRSSRGKQPVMFANTQGVIDSSYYGNSDNGGNIGIRLFNLGKTIYTVHAGDRVAQGTFVKYPITEDDDATAERVSGYGSTGV